MAVADEEGLVVGGRVGEAGEDGIYEVADVGEAALVGDGAEGDGKFLVDEVDEAGHVARAVDERGANDGVGHGGTLAEFDELLFGGEFALAVGGIGVAGGVFGENFGASSGHGSDRANEDEVFDASFD